MQLEGTLDLERRRVRRWVPIVAIVVPVFLLVAAATWFIRAFIAPPMVAIVAPTTIAKVSLPERHPAPAASRQPAPSESARASAYAAPAEPASPTPLPMFATFAIAPPAASLRTAPAAIVEPAPNAVPAPAQADDAGPAPAPTAAPDVLASLPQPGPDGAATDVLEPSAPPSGSIPLPPHRRSLSPAQIEGRVPLPRARPAEETSSANVEVERRVFSAHGSE